MRTRTRAVDLPNESLQSTNLALGKLEAFSISSIRYRTSPLLLHSYDKVLVFVNVAGYQVPVLPLHGTSVPSLSCVSGSTSVHLAIP